MKLKKILYITYNLLSLKLFTIIILCRSLFSNIIMDSNIPLIIKSPTTESNNLNIELRFEFESKTISYMQYLNINLPKWNSNLFKVNRDNSFYNDIYFCRLTDIYNNILIDIKADPSIDTEEFNIIYCKLTDQYNDIKLKTSYMLEISINNLYINNQYDLNNVGLFVSTTNTKDKIILYNLPSIGSIGLYDLKRISNNFEYINKYETNLLKDNNNNNINTSINRKIVNNSNNIVVVNTIYGSFTNILKYHNIKNFNIIKSSIIKKENNIEYNQNKIDINYNQKIYPYSHFILELKCLVNYNLYSDNYVFYLNVPIDITEIIDNKYEKFNAYIEYLDTKGNVLRKARLVYKIMANRYIYLEGFESILIKNLRFNLYFFKFKAKNVLKVYNNLYGYNKFALNIYYKNSFSLVSQSYSDTLYISPYEFHNIKIYESENNEYVYSNSAWPITIEFSSKSVITNNINNFFLLQHINLQKQILDLKFIASTCDFTDDSFSVKENAEKDLKSFNIDFNNYKNKDTFYYSSKNINNLIRAGIKCIPFNNKLKDFNQHNNTNYHNGSGILFKIPFDIKENTIYKFKVWIMIDFCQTKSNNYNKFKFELSIYSKFNQSIKNGYNLFSKNIHNEYQLDNKLSKPYEIELNQLCYQGILDFNIGNINNKNNINNYKEYDKVFLKEFTNIKLIKNKFNNCKVNNNNLGKTHNIDLDIINSCYIKNINDLHKRLEYSLDQVNDEEDIFVLIEGEFKLKNNNYLKQHFPYPIIIDQDKDFNYDKYSPDNLPVYKTLDGHLNIFFKKDFFDNGNFYKKNKCYFSLGFRSDNKDSNIQSSLYYNNMLEFDYKKSYFYSDYTKNNVLSTNKDYYNQNLDINKSLIVNNNLNNPFRISSNNINKKNNFFDYTKNKYIKCNNESSDFCLMYFLIYTDCLKLKSFKKSKKQFELKSIFYSFNVQMVYYSFDNNKSRPARVIRFIKLYPEFEFFSNNYRSYYKDKDLKNNISIFHAGVSKNLFTYNVCIIELDYNNIRDFVYYSKNYLNNIKVNNKKFNNDNNLSNKNFNSYSLDLRIHLYNLSLIDTDYNDITSIYPILDNADNYNTIAYGYNSETILLNNMYYSNSKNFPNSKNLNTLDIPGYLLYLSSYIVIPNLESIKLLLSNNSLLIPVKCPRERLVNKEKQIDNLNEINMNNNNKEFDTNNKDIKYNTTYEISYNNPIISINSIINNKKYSNKSNTILKVINFIPKTRINNVTNFFVPANIINENLTLLRSNTLRYNLVLDTLSKKNNKQNIYLYYQDKASNFNKYSTLKKNIQQELYISSIVWLFSDELNTFINYNNRYTKSNNYIKSSYNININVISDQNNSNEVSNELKMSYFYSNKNNKNNTINNKGFNIMGNFFDSIYINVFKKDIYVPLNNETLIRKYYLNTINNQLEDNLSNTSVSSSNKNINPLIALKNFIKISNYDKFYDKLTKTYSLNNHIALFTCHTIGKNKYGNIIKMSNTISNYDNNNFVNDFEAFEIDEYEGEFSYYSNYNNNELNETVEGKDIFYRGDFNNQYIYYENDLSSEIYFEFKIKNNLNSSTKDFNIPINSNIKFYSIYFSEDTKCAFKFNFNVDRSYNECNLIYDTKLKIGFKCYFKNKHKLILTLLKFYCVGIISSNKFNIDELKFFYEKAVNTFINTDVLIFKLSSEIFKKHAIFNYMSKLDNNWKLDSPYFRYPYISNIFYGHSYHNHAYGVMILEITVPNNIPLDSTILIDSKFDLNIINNILPRCYVSNSKDNNNYVYSNSYLNETKKINNTNELDKDMYLKGCNIKHKSKLDNVNFNQIYLEITIKKIIIKTKLLAESKFLYVQLWPIKIIDYNSDIYKDILYKIDIVSSVSGVQITSFKESYLNMPYPLSMKNELIIKTRPMLEDISNKLCKIVNIFPYIPEEEAFIDIEFNLNYLLYINNTLKANEISFFFFPNIIFGDHQFKYVCYVISNIKKLISVDCNSYVPGILNLKLEKYINYEIYDKITIRISGIIIVPEMLIENVYSFNTLNYLLLSCSINHLNKFDFRYNIVTGSGDVMPMYNLNNLFKTKLIGNLLTFNSKEFSFFKSYLDTKMQPNKKSDISILISLDNASISHVNLPQELYKPIFIITFPEEFNLRLLIKQLKFKNKYYNMDSIYSNLEEAKEENINENVLNETSSFDFNKNNIEIMLNEWVLYNNDFVSINNSVDGKDFSIKKEKEYKVIIINNYSNTVVIKIINLKENILKISSFFAYWELNIKNINTPMSNYFKEISNIKVTLTNLNYDYVFKSYTNLFSSFTRNQIGEIYSSLKSSSKEKYISNYKNNNYYYNILVNKYLINYSRGYSYIYNYNKFVVDFTSQLKSNISKTKAVITNNSFNKLIMFSPGRFYSFYLIVSNTVNVLNIEPLTLSLDDSTFNLLKDKYIIYPSMITNKLYIGTSCYTSIGNYILSFNQDNIVNYTPLSKVIVGLSSVDSTYIYVKYSIDSIPEGTSTFLMYYIENNIKISDKFNLTWSYNNLNKDYYTPIISESSFYTGISSLGYNQSTIDTANFNEYNLVSYSVYADPFVSKDTLMHEDLSNKDIIIKKQFKVKNSSYCYKLKELSINFNIKKQYRNEYNNNLKRLTKIFINSNRNDSISTNYINYNFIEWFELLNYSNYKGLNTLFALNNSNLNDVKLNANSLIIILNIKIKKILPIFIYCMLIDINEEFPSMSLSDFISDYINVRTYLSQNDQRVYSAMYQEYVSINTKNIYIKFNKLNSNTKYKLKCQFTTTESYKDHRDSINTNEMHQLKYYNTDILKDIQTLDTPATQCLYFVFNDTINNLLRRNLIHQCQLFFGNNSDTYGCVACIDNKGENFYSKYYLLDIINNNNNNIKNYQYNNNNKIQTDSMYFINYINDNREYYSTNKENEILICAVVNNYCEFNVFDFFFKDFDDFTKHSFNNTNNYINNISIITDKVYPDIKNNNLLANIKDNVFSQSDGIDTIIFVYNKKLVFLFCFWKISNVFSYNNKPSISEMKICFNSDKLEFIEYCGNFQVSNNNNVQITFSKEKQKLKIGDYKIWVFCYNDLPNSKYHSDVEELNSFRIVADIVINN